MNKVSALHDERLRGWICRPCGLKHGRWFPGHVSTYHEPDKNDPQDRCGWCGTRDESLTEPRDFGL
jgi:hypothetical protein